MHIQNAFTNKLQSRFTATKTCFSKTECVEHSSIFFVPSSSHSQLEYIFYDRRKIRSGFLFPVLLSRLSAAKMLSILCSAFRFSIVHLPRKKKRTQICQMCTHAACTCVLCVCVCLDSQRPFLRKMFFFIFLFYSVFCVPIWRSTTKTTSSTSFFFVVIFLNFWLRTK